MEYLVGHLLGDFVLQNDWMASNKRTSTKHCLIHVLIYSMAVTTCVLITQGQANPSLFYWIAVPHFLIDRFGLARRWMTLAGQEGFATGPLAPWSIVAVDQSLHAICLMAAALANTRL